MAWDDSDWGGFDIGDVAQSVPSYDMSSSYSLPDFSSMFSLDGGEGAPMGIESGGYSLGVDRGGGASGSRLSTEAMAPAGATPGGASGGGWGDWLKSFTNNWVSPIGDIAKAVLPLAGMGIAGMNVANSIGARDRMDRTEPVVREAQKVQIESARKGQELAPVAAALTPQIAAVAPRQGEISQTVQRTIAAPQVEYATGILNAVRAGQLPAAEEAEVERWKRGELQKYRDYFSRSGMGDSTAILQVEGMVGEQAQAMRADRLRKLEQTALQYLGGGREGYNSAGTLNESEARILQGAAGPIGVAGQVLAGSAGAASGAGRSAQAEQESLEKLLQDAYRQLSSSMAGTAK